MLQIPRRGIRSADQVQVKIYLEHFDFSGPDTVELGEGITLQKLTDKERSDLAQDPAPGAIFHQFSPMPGDVQLIGWALQRERIGPRVNTWMVQADLGLVELTASLIRCIHPGHFFWRAVKADESGWGSDAPFTFSSGRYPDVSPLQEITRITESDIALVRTALHPFLEWMTTSDGNTPIALSRFNDGCKEPRPEDKIIDLAISLESSLLGGERVDQKLRFALRGASLLAQNDSERGQLFDLLSQVYDARSATVHGGKPDLSTLKLADIEGVTGRVLVRLSELGGEGFSHKKILRNLERYVLERQNHETLSDYLRRASQSQART